MTMRLLRWLIGLSLALMPLAMMGNAATAAPHHASVAAAEPCPDFHQPPEEDRGPERSVHCMIGCTALPPGDGGVAARVPVRTLVQEHRPAERLDGLSPEAADPPPRLS